MKIFLLLPLDKPLTSTYMVSQGGRGVKEYIEIHKGYIEMIEWLMYDNTGKKLLLLLSFCVAVGCIDLYERFME